MAITQNDLEAVAQTFSLARNGTGAVAPGQRVEVSVVSSLTQIGVLDALAVPLFRPVSVTVEWDVVLPGGGDGTEGTDYLTSPASDLAAGFVIAPPVRPAVTDLDSDPYPDEQFQIRARVSVTADGLTSGRDLLLPLPVASLRLPELVALFRHYNFAPYDDNEPGFLLLVVPKWSPIRALGPSFNDLMKELDLLVRPLRSLARFGRFLVGLEALQLAAAGQPMTRVHVDNVPDLEDVHMRVETFLGSDWLNRDLRAGDRVSSLIVLGPPGTTVTFYDDEEYDLSDGEWAFEVTTGLEMVVVMRGLGSNVPLTMPADRADLLQPGGGSPFDDNLSSVKFGSHRTG